MRTFPIYNNILQMNEYMILRNILRNSKSSKFDVQSTYKLKDDTPVILNETCLNSMKLISVNLKQIHSVLQREMILFKRILYGNNHQHHNAKYFKRMKQVKIQSI